MIHLLALLACARPDSAILTPLPEKSPASPQPEGAPEIQVVRLDPEELSWDQAAGTVTFSPGSRRMAAEYTTWILDSQGVLDAAGGPLMGPLEVRVEVTDFKREVHIPNDPKLPSPQGGFVYYTYRGRVLGKAP
jgi:hypothetical protein